MIESRKITDLTPETQVLYWKFAEEMAKAHIPFMVTSTFRDQERQNVLFEKGRTTPGPIVTWTRTSRHTSRTAFDIAILRDGQPTWNTKVDVSGDGIPDYQQAGAIGEMVGLTAGAFWTEKKRDFPHFQNDQVKEV